MTSSQYIGEMLVLWSLGNPCTRSHTQLNAGITVHMSTLDAIASQKTLFNLILLIFAFSQVEGGAYF